MTAIIRTRKLDKPHAYDAQEFVFPANSPSARALDVVCGYLLVADEEEGEGLEELSVWLVRVAPGGNVTRLPPAARRYVGKVMVDGVFWAVFAVQNAPGPSLRPARPRPEAASTPQSAPSRQPSTETANIGLDPAVASLFA